MAEQVFEKMHATVSLQKFFADQRRLCLQYNKNNENVQEIHNRCNCLSFSDKEIKCENEWPTKS